MLPGRIEQLLVSWQGVSGQTVVSMRCGAAGVRSAVGCCNIIKNKKAESIEQIAELRKNWKHRESQGRKPSTYIDTCNYNLLASHEVQAQSFHRAEIWGKGVNCRIEFH